MPYFLEDIIIVSASVLISLFFLGYLLFRGQLLNGLLLLVFVTLLSISGFSDAVFRFNPHPNLVVMADGLNIFCFTIELAILLHFSTVYFIKKPSQTPLPLDAVIYLPAVIISALYSLSPLMVSGVTANTTGFQMNYNPGYWTIVVYGAVMAIISLIFIFITLLRDPDAEDRNEVLFLLLVLILMIFFYGSVLVVPFLYNFINFVSPMPIVFAVLALVYSYISHGYFSLGLGKNPPA